MSKNNVINRLTGGLQKINEDSIDLLSNFSYFRFYYASKKTRRKFGGFFGSKLSDGLSLIHI